jgi:hypothetical protein
MNKKQMKKEQYDMDKLITNDLINDISKKLKELKLKYNIHIADLKDVKNTLVHISNIHGSILDRYNPQETLT